MLKDSCIVIIDDDHDDSALLNECFQKFHSLPVHSFNRGSSFFHFIDHDEPRNISLIVVDLNLPEINGVNIVKKIKENTQLSSVPVLVFTTGGTPAEIEFCKKLNIEIFRKPNSIK